MPPFDRIPFILNQIPDQATQMQALHDAMTEAAADAAKEAMDRLFDTATLMVHWRGGEPFVDSYVAIKAFDFADQTGRSAADILESLRRQPEPPG